MDQAAAFEKLSKCLHQAQEAPTLEQSRTLIAEAIQRVERLSKAVLTAAEKRGRMGGTETVQSARRSLVADRASRLPKLNLILRSGFVYSKARRLGLGAIESRPASPFHYRRQAVSCCLSRIITR
jgi:hypothetical protein